MTAGQFAGTGGKFAIAIGGGEFAQVAGEAASVGSAPAPGVRPPPSCEWLLLRVYALFPPVIGLLEGLCGSGALVGVEGEQLSQASLRYIGRPLSRGGGTSRFYADSCMKLCKIVKL